MASWQIPAEYRKWTLTDFGLDRMQTWDHCGFFMAGKQGCGKSCLAGALVRDRMNPAHPATIADISGNSISYSPSAVGWYYAPAMIARVKDSWKREGESKAIEALLAPSVLVLDDLGTERRDDATASILRAFLEFSINGGKNIIVTSNFSLKEIAGLDQRVASRLAMLQPVELPQVDHRAEARASMTPIKAGRRNGR